MKNLKIRLGLFSLLAILAVSVFLTSCEQEQITDFTPEQQVEYRNESIMIMPFGIAKDAKEIRAEYMGNATSELMNKMTENGRVAYYLMSINKLEEAAAQMSYGDFFCDINLTSILTEAEIVGLQNYSISTSEVELRGCSAWEGTGECEWQSWGFGMWRCCKFVRDCSWWQWWSDETKWECS